ncbi:MAG: hypothetical protein Ct9H300mP8_12540 [Gammaproteobacteria bacterium]|nr:MAG: hypothetical protein Ct9H300mP8_12540 [Gammaproteobacteria bacterium]
MHLRQTTGLGQHIDMSMLDATIVTDDQLLYHLEDSHETGPAVSEFGTRGLVRSSSQGIFDTFGAN